jgi:hypothetical protein
MDWRPRLNVICGRCGKAHGLFGTCVSNSARRQTLKPKLTFGKCPKCKRPYGPGGVLTHACAPKSDFRKRKKKAEQDEAKRKREEARRNQPKHDYRVCTDADCKRSLCVAYKAGEEAGDERGFERGWQQGYARGLVEPTKESK